MVPHLRLATARVLAIKQARRVGPLGCVQPGWLGLKRCSRWRRRAPMQSRAHAQTSERFADLFLGKLSLDRVLVALGEITLSVSGRRRFRVQSCASSRIIDGQSRCLRFCFQSGVLGFAVPSPIELPAHIDADIPLDVSLDNTVIAF